MKSSGKSDEDIVELLKVVELEYLVDREDDGFESTNDWNDTLSGGEKQRIAMARLFYHNPKYAIFGKQ